jgi:hypothetical protein
LHGLRKRRTTLAPTSAPNAHRERNQACENEISMADARATSCERALFTRLAGLDHELFFRSR